MKIKETFHSFKHKYLRGSHFRGNLYCEFTSELVAFRSVSSRKAFKLFFLRWVIFEKNFVYNFTSSSLPKENKQKALKYLL